MMHIDQIATATLEQLTDELAAAGWDSTQADIREAREAVARLLHETAGPFDLRGEDNETIRKATVEETVASILAGAEGWIRVDGVRCYVAA
jgi:hypothetical protein